MAPANISEALALLPLMRTVSGTVSLVSASDVYSCAVPFLTYVVIHHSVIDGLDINLAACHLDIEHLLIAL